MTTPPLVLHVVTASTRQGRKGPAVADWVVEQALGHGAFHVERVDLLDMDLPVFDEPEHPRLGRYQHEHTRRWSETVARADAFAIVTPEYNFFPPSSLVNALTYLHAEWAGKPVGIVSYGGASGGLRATEALKPLLTALAMMPVPQGVALQRFTQFLEAGVFDPGEGPTSGLQAMLTELHRWAVPLAAMRSDSTAH